MVREVFEKNGKHANYFFCTSSIHAPTGLLASHIEQHIPTGVLFKAAIESVVQVLEKAA